MEKRLSTLICLYGYLVLGAVFENIYCVTIMIVMSIIMLISYSIQKFKN